jgi:threonine dehydratase
LSDDQPTLGKIRSTRARLGERVVRTPVRRLEDDRLARLLGSSTQIFLKEELFQKTGSFKPRGALAVMLDLPPDALARGVTAVSAGNHAMAVGYAARSLGTSAKVVMPKNANPYRVQGCRDLGAEVELVDDVHVAFARVHEIQEKEGRTFVHPFEGPKTALGTATIGLEFLEDVPDLDAVIVPIGGGGLIAGIASAVKLLRPQTLVFGVEPEGADSMHRSFAAGQPQKIEAVRTIADSLGAPHAAPYSFALTRRYVDELVMVNDDQLRAGMDLLFRSAKLAVEPAGAAATAALCGPLRRRLEGKRVGVVVCGANIDPQTFATYLADAKPVFES